MKRYILYALMLCLNTLLLFSMDVDNSGEANQRTPTSAQAPLPREYCLLVKVDDSDELIGIPVELEKFFKEKIEIAQTINPETMVYVARQITAAEAHNAIRTLFNLLGMGKERLYEEIIAPTPIDELIGLAHASTVLNLYALKNLIRDALIYSVKKQLQQLKTVTEKIAFLEKLNKLEDTYIVPLKYNPTLPFRNFFLTIRDSERLSPMNTKTITSLPLVENKNFFLTAHGSHILWLDNNNQLQIQDLSTLAISSFNPIDAQLNSNANIHLVATPHGSHVCLWQDKNNVVCLLNNTTEEFEILSNNNYIKQIALSNDGTYIALAGEHGINLTPLTDKSANYYIFPKPSQTSTLKSCFFSRNGQFLYAHYKEGGTDFLRIYVTKNGRVLAPIEYEKKLYHVYPGKEENSFWELTDAGIRKLSLIDYDGPDAFKLDAGILINTATNPRNVEYMLVNNDESYILLQTNRSAVELINVPARRTECIYNMFQTTAFSPNQNGLIAIEDEDNEDGTYNILAFSFLPTIVTTEIHQLFDSLTLAQIMQLEQLISIKDKNRMIQQIKEFLKQFPYTLQQLINIYVFPGLIHQRPQSPSDEQPAKRQKKA